VLVTAALAAALAGCGSQTPASPPVQDHVHGAVAGLHPGEVLLATHYGMRISEDGGRTWPPAGDLAHAQMRLLIADGAGYVAVTARPDGSSDVRRSDDARRWTAGSGIPSGHPVSALVPGVSPGSAWAEVADVGIFGTTDAGRTWSVLLPTPLTINDMVAETGPSGLFAYASSRGLFLARGSQLALLFDAPVLDGDIQSVTHWNACAACLVASLSGAVATSADGGLHWSSHATTIPFTQVESWTRGGGALLGLAPAPASPQHGLYRSDDGGATWTRVIDAALVDHLYLDDPATPLLAFQWGIDAYESDDSGRTWAPRGALRS